MKTKRRSISTVALSAVALFAALSAARLAQGQDSNAPYASKAPIDQYLMADRDAEIALARTAAPKSISDGAEVLVLGRDGYTTAVKGENGFVCLVERAFARLHRFLRVLESQESIADLPECGGSTGPCSLAEVEGQTGVGRKVQG